MALLLIEPILKAVASEGIKRIFNYISEKIVKVRNIKHLAESIQKRLEKDFKSSDIDLELYIKNYLNVESLNGMTEEEIQERIQSELETKLESSAIQKIIKQIQRSLKSDNYYFTLNILEKFLTKTFFYEIFSDAKVSDLIWNAFHIEILRIFNKDDILIELFRQRMTSDDIKRIVTAVIEDTNINRRQREIYEKTWYELIDLQDAAEKLWEKANKRNLLNFFGILLTTKKSIKRSSIFIESEHIEELEALFHLLNIYFDRKERLVKIKFSESRQPRYDERSLGVIKTSKTEKLLMVKKTTFVEDDGEEVVMNDFLKNNLHKVHMSDEANALIQENKTYRARYKKLINSLMNEFRAKVLK